MKCVIGILVLQLLIQCRSRGVPEDSHISYQKSGTVSGDVYLQIATNLAEKFTTPIYSFFGFRRNRTGSIFKKRWDSIETLDESNEVSNLRPHDNNDLEERDIEQLSLEALQKEVQKPEKIYQLPEDLNLGTLKNTESNKSYQIIHIFNDVDSQEAGDTDGIADNSDGKKNESGFVYFLELAGSFIQLIFGALSQLFKPSSS